LVQVSKTRRVKREVDPHRWGVDWSTCARAAAARPFGLEPADAGGPGTWGRRPRTAAAGGRPQGRP